MRDRKPRLLLPGERESNVGGWIAVGVILFWMAFAAVMVWS